KGGGDVFVADADVRALDAEALVIGKFNRGQHFEFSLEAQRLAFVDIQVSDARLRNRLQALLFGFLTEVARDQGFNDFSFNLLSKAPAQDALRDTSLPEARQ